MAKTKYTCEKCGTDFKAGRTLGKHYDENPAHRPPEKVVKHRTAKGSSDSFLKQAIAVIDKEIAEKRAFLQNVEKIKTDITKLETRKKTLSDLLPAETPI